MSTKSFILGGNLKLLSPNTRCFQYPRVPSSKSCPFPLPIYPRSRFSKRYLPHPPLAQSHPTNQSSQAQESICRFLQEQGLSLEDSLSIASNSPKYTQMLVDSVNDLEEWNTWNRGNSEAEKLEFKELVLCMAKEKGDAGKVAFLESVGLTLPSSMSIARYLSYESLPALVHRVKYMKEVFFSSSDDKGLIGKNARRMMMHLSIPIDEDVQQTLSFFEKIEARRGGLEMLGSVNSTFRFLIESFPSLLALPLDSHLKPMVEFLEKIGVPKESMGNILLLFPPIIFRKISDIKAEAVAMEKIGATNEYVRKMLLKYPWIFSSSVWENYKQIVSYFNEEKVPKRSIDRSIRSWPHILGCSTSKIKSMVEEFAALGVRNKKLGQIIAKSPQLLLKKPEEFLKVVLFLEDLGFDRETVGKILCRCPEIFVTSIDKTLNRKIKFLADIGISKNHLPRVIKKYPELLVSDVDRTLFPRMRYLAEIGISKTDIGFMVRRFSPLLGYSIEEVLRPKLEFLLNIMEKPVTEVVDYPRYFSYSLEKKIKPRYWVIKGRNIRCSLKDMLGKNDEDFAAEFLGVGTTLIPPPYP